MDNPVTRISVRNLVEFILQSGDLDNRRGTIDKDAMLKGSRLHRKLQKQMGGDYRAEVALRMNCSYEDLDIRLEGRADGIFTEDEVVWIDEIKGIYGNVEQMEEPVKVHKAQAMCYGYIYGVQEGLSKIGIQMTYANLETEVVKRFREVISIEELKEWYQKLLDEYHKWLSYQKKWKEERNHSLQSLEFPFFYREGQRKMVSSVYHAIGASRQIFIQAPTGVGKTMSTIFPAVRAVGEGKGETIFYLTAKTITRTVAQEAFEVLREKGMKYKVVTITAKEKLCFMDETKCDPVHCPYARGHFDRVNDAVYELWTTKSRYDRETIREQAEKWQVCPFEMCLDLSLWVDAVICDEDNCGKRYFKVDFDGRIVSFDINEASDFMLAYATTIHKSQGSEYDIVVMPLTNSNYMMLQRNLLYTGVTRAKKVFVLFGQKQAVATAIKTLKVVKRNTRLAERIVNAAGLMAYDTFKTA